MGDNDVTTDVIGLLQMTAVPSHLLGRDSPVEDLRGAVEGGLEVRVLPVHVIHYCQ